jgi:hypothetical protein
MKLLKCGELYALDRRASFEAQYAEMLKRFRAKHKREPIDVCWNPKGFKFEPKEPPREDSTIPPGTVWLELPGAKG